MIEAEVEYGTTPELTADMIRAQLDLLVHDEVFRTSKRSVAFLKYVVEQTLNGSADQIKERTIGIEVFERDPSYDTNLDHIVRTAATELRKRLATYYVDEKHRSELRVELVPGSYIPRFMLPGQARHSAAEPGIEPETVEGSAEAHHSHALPGPIPLAGSKIAAKESAPWWRHAYLTVAVVGVAATLVVAGYAWMHRPSAEDLFWKPVVETPGPVLLAVGDHPNGPPTVACRRRNRKHGDPRPKFGLVADGPFCRHRDDRESCWGVGGQKQAGRHPQRQRELLFRSQRAAPQSLLAPSIMSGACA